jgi:hypothetical protein
VRQRGQRRVQARTRIMNQLQAVALNEGTMGELEGTTPKKK